MEIFDILGVLIRCLRSRPSAYSCCCSHLVHVSIFMLQAPQRMDNHGSDAQDNLKVKRPLHRLVAAIVHSLCK